MSIQAKKKGVEKIKPEILSGSDKPKGKNYADERQGIFQQGKKKKKGNEENNKSLIIKARELYQKKIGSTSDIMWMIASILSRCSIKQSWIIIDKTELQHNIIYGYRFILANSSSDEW